MSAKGGGLEMFKQSDKNLENDKKPSQNKGGFYSEGADTFVISSNRQTLLFS